MSNLSHLQLIEAIQQDLRHLAEDIKWKTNMVGQQSSSITGGTPTGAGPSDPTHRQATNPLATHITRRLSDVHRDLTWLYQRKMPEIVGRLELDDDRGAKGGGLSAYRGDRKAPAGRPDLQAALEAQARRNHRGDSHGAG